MTSRTLACMLLCCAPATATPPQSTLHPDGTLKVNGQPVTRIPAGLGQLLASHRVRIGKRQLLHVLVGTNVKANRRYEIVMLLTSKRVTLLHRGMTGPQDEEEETWKRLRVSPRGILSYETRQGYQDCSGQPLMLFPQLYDFERARFRPVVRRAVPAPARWLRATRERPSAVATAETSPTHSTLRFLAATTQSGASDASSLAPTVALVDTDPATYWAAGHVPSGHSQVLVARGNPSAYPVLGLRLTQTASRASRHLLTFVLELSESTRYLVRLPKPATRGPTTYYILLPKPVQTRCVALRPREIRPKGARLALRISELQVLSTIDGPGGKQRIVSDALSADASRAGRAFSLIRRLGAHGLPLLETLSKNTSSLHGPQMVRALARLRGRRATRLLLLLATRTTSGALNGQLKSLLAKRAGHLVPLLIAKVDTAPAATKPLLAELLARAGGPKALQKLIALAGDGSSRIRAAITDGLAAIRAPDAIPLLLQALQTTRAPRKRADLIQVLGRRGRLLSKAKKAVFITALLSATAGEQFEARYRLYRALGRLGHPMASSVLLGAAVDRDPILRWQAITALNRLPVSSKITAQLLRACQDPDPRARSAALKGLGRHLGRPVVSAQLVRSLYDPWPLPAAAAAWSLGRHCVSDSYAPLAAVAFRRGHGIDREAIAALLRCKAPNTFSALFRIARSRKQPPALRQHALASLPRHAMRGNEKALLHLFLRQRQLARQYVSAERVAAAAARTLGRARYHRALAPLMHALTLDPSPTIRAATATALGELCLPRVRRALQRARNDRAPVVRAAAQHALINCVAATSP